MSETVPQVSVEGRVAANVHAALRARILIAAVCVAHVVTGCRATDDGDHRGSASALPATASARAPQPAESVDGLQGALPSAAPAGIPGSAPPPSAAFVGIPPGVVSCALFRLPDAAGSPEVVFARTDGLSGATPPSLIVFRRALRLPGSRTSASFQADPSWNEIRLWDLPDVTDDGAGDLAIGVPNADVGSQRACGLLIVVDGATLREVSRIRGSRQSARLGSSVAVVSRLPEPWILVASPGAATVEALTPPTWSTVQQWRAGTATDRYGQSLAVAESPLGEPPALLAIGATELGLASSAAQGLGPGRVRLQSIAGAEPSRVLVGDHLGEQFGASLAFVDDCDADGLVDLAVGAPNSGTATFPGAGRVTCYSTRNGAELWRRLGSAQYSALGAFLAMGPDIDGDGISEVLSTESGSGAASDCAIVVISGKSGSVLATIGAPVRGDGIAVLHAQRRVTEDGTFGVALTHGGDLLTLRAAAHKVVLLPIPSE